MPTEWLIVLGAVLALGVLVRLAFSPEIKACFERDPAAKNVVEVLLTYSGLHVYMAYCLAHPLEKIGIPILPRLIMTVARGLTGVEIHPGAVIGRGLFIDHGMGVVIGETSVIGKNVTLFQGVTLGGTGKKKGKRHPNIGDNVVVGTGAKVLGDITVGEHSIIGANAVVVRDVPPHSTVVGVPGRIAKIKDKRFQGINLDHTHLPDPLAESLQTLQHEIDLIEQRIKEHRESQSPRKKDE